MGGRYRSARKNREDRRKRFNRVMVQMEIDRELDRALEKRAVDLDLSKRDCVELALRAWLDEGKAAA